MEYPDPDVANPLMNAVLGLDALLAESPSFQRRVCEGVEPGADAARAKIKLLEFEPDTGAEGIKVERPYGAIWPDHTTWRRKTNEQFDRTGQLNLLLTDRNRHPGREIVNRRASGIDFLEWVGAVVEEIIGHEDMDGHLRISQIGQQERDGPGRAASKDEDQDGGHWWIQYRISWGSGEVGA